METKKIFVIMPFKKSPTRDSDDLTEFYKTNIKEFIESCSDFKYRYKVTRSEDAFDIQDQIIKDLYAADIVLCDLSGKNANPNVMYELGVRFGVSPKPVILFREEHEENDSIFDVYGFHTFYYKATQYSKLQNHIKKKILDYEEDISRYESPVIKILKRSMSIEKEVERRKAYSLMISLEYGAIGMIRNAAGALNELFEDNSTLEMPPKYNDAISYIVKNYGEIKDLDFSRFYFRPNRFPSLETFITDLPLRDLIE